MPPRTRGRVVSKTLKENIEVIQKNTMKSGKVPKPIRKALADKTNSASDDNSVEVPVKVKKTVSKGVSKVDTQNDAVRPRRDRRLPNRFVENHVLKNLSNSKEFSVASISENVEVESPSKKFKSEVSPFISPAKLETSLIVTRPRRVCRLPSRLEDHTLSPNKHIAVHPCHASTPIQQSKGKKNTNKEDKCCIKDKKPAKKVTAKNVKTSSKKVTIQKQVEKKEKISPDTNNNPKRVLRNQSIKTFTVPSHSKTTSPNNNLNKPTGKRLIENNFSFKVLEDKKQSPSNDRRNIDVYEFTFDPTEEPPPQKKKRKKVVKKKPVKPKSVVFKSNYDQNLSKALNALKNVVKKKSPQLQNTKTPNLVNEKGTNIGKGNIIEIPDDTAGGALLPKITSNTVENTIIVNNHASIQIEDIAADFEPIEDDHHEAINYSPVNSPNPHVSPNLQHKSPVKSSHINDPLNLQTELSFFDEQPVASSSMNVSVRHPLASPWRVEFGSLPIRWQSNTYVKANMTPAVESSFIHFDDSNKKKHVYTNLVPDTNEILPQIVDCDTTNLKQTSIISFIKEVAERSASKRKRDRSVTPSKVNSLFEDITNNTHSERTPKKMTTKNDNKPTTPNKSAENISNNRSNTSNENQNSNGSESTKTIKQKATDKNNTFFGFDDSENFNQENVSPVKVNPKVRALRPRSRAVLQEINAQCGPMRAELPLAAKTKLASSDAVNKVYEQLKAADAPLFPEKNAAGVVTTAIENQSWHENDNDDESVHLFEDIALIHHLKPTRKSYGKAKKVTFRQMSSSNGDTENIVAENQGETSDEDDLADLSFHVPTVKEKRTVKKKKNSKKVKITRKEEKEVEEWAAGFNSMCEEIEDFPLMVE